jgi:hypothetical protein
MTEYLNADENMALVLDLIRQERQGVRLQFVTGPYTAFVATGALQLAWRHPGMGNFRDMIRDLGEQLTAAFDEPTRALIAKGWDIDYDLP